KGEDDVAAALRELAEETGIVDAQLIEGFQHEMTYFFRDKARGLIRKTVVLFLAETKMREIRLSHEHSGGEFLPFEKAMKRVTYKNAKEALREANEFLGDRVS